MGGKGSLTATNVLNPFNLVTTANTANQSIGSYTVPAGEVFRIQAIIVQVYLTTASQVASYLGTVKVQIGAADWIGAMQAVNTTSGAVFGFVFPTGQDGIDIYAGVAIAALCTPASATSTTWVVNLVGYKVP
ncbi:MAG: hypothetical protein ABSA75_13485 [Candidatus Bathyarchaeia archaeon]|jgi:hypothetical protein